MECLSKRPLAEAIYESIKINARHVDGVEPMASARRIPFPLFLEAEHLHCANMQNAILSPKLANYFCFGVVGE